MFFDNSGFGGQYCGTHHVVRTLVWVRLCVAVYSLCLCPHVADAKRPVLFKPVTSVRSGSRESHWDLILITDSDYQSHRTHLPLYLFPYFRVTRWNRAGKLCTSSCIFLMVSTGPVSPCCTAHRNIILRRVLLSQEVRTRIRERISFPCAPIRNPS